MAVIALVALVAVRRQEFRFAFTLTAAFGAVTRREEHVATARVADVGGVESLVVRSVESRLTFVAVDALRVVTAVLADAAAFVIAVDVQRLTPLLHFVVEFALLRVTETMTGFAVEWSVGF